ncbi:MAG TPA: GNAT family N-acetyltransferase [Beijerinckiaceae bacterium]|nr:GNAT family N-acetyltransferase [Beijerinckiaceae bacterium]
MSLGDIKTYPRKAQIEGGEIELRLMGAKDEKAVAAFAKALPVHDLLFLPRDITQAKVLKAWIAESERGGMTSLIAVKGKEVVGCAAIVTDPLSWSPHVGEIRVVTSSSVRGEGVGRVLTHAAFSLALSSGLEKLVVQMTVDQKGGIALFEGLGFKAEALLRDHVRDKSGKKHDIVVLGHDVAKVWSQMQAFGLPSAVG